ncbi:MAG: riboflavin synthase [Nevskiales bacterium]|nr:riboflavin synthase [Nevskiales bacterium]
MFTGIIESIGEVVSVEPRGGDVRMRIAAPDYLQGLRIGDSVATNGVCLTAIEIGDGGYVADLSAETLSLTTAAGWAPGRRVNLERALTPDKPLGGHLVSGHVDGVGKLLSKHEDARSWRLEFESDQSLAKYIPRKGSICIDGVSLTVNDVDGARFGVNIVPHTAEHTTLGLLQPGDAVNLEVDLIARYLERLLAQREE